MADQTEIPQAIGEDPKPAEGEQMDFEPEAPQPNGTEKPGENGAEEAPPDASDPASKRSREGEEGEGAEEGENGVAKKHKSETSAEGLEENEDNAGKENEEGEGREGVDGGEGEGEGEGVHGGEGEGEGEGVHGGEGEGGDGDGGEGEGEGEGVDGGEGEEGHEDGFEEGMEEVKGGDGPTDGPTKEVAPVSLGPKLFKTSVEMFDYFIKLLHYWPPNVDVNKYEFMVLTDLIKKGHPDPEKKNGIRAFQVRFHPMWQSRCFFIMREDGHCDDFSFRKCVDRILPLPPHMKANAGNARSGGHHGGGRGGGSRGSGGGGRGGRGGGQFRGRGRGRRGGFRN